jgi:hypothetical protein
LVVISWQHPAVWWFPDLRKGQLLVDTDIMGQSLILARAEVTRLVQENSEDRQWGFLGEPERTYSN